MRLTCIRYYILLVFCSLQFPANAQNNATSWEINYNKGKSLNSEQKYMDAIGPLEIALKIAEKEFTKNDIRTGKTAKELAISEENIGKLDLALIHHKLNSDIIRKKLGEATKEYAESLSDEVLMYLKLSKFEDALSKVNQSLQIIEKYGEKEKSLYAYLKSLLARLYFEEGKFDLAENLAFESLELMKKIDETRTDNYSQLLQTISEIYRRTGKNDKALTYAIESLKNTENDAGKKSATRAFYLNNISGIYRTLGQYDSAINSYSESMKIIAETMGKNSDPYAEATVGLASVYRELGQFDKALPLYLETLRIDEKVYGKDHNIYNIHSSGLALLYSQIGQHDKALPIVKKSIENIEKTLGKNHPEYLRALTNLGGIYGELKQYDKSISTSIEALKIAEIILGKNHFLYGATLATVSTQYFNNKQYEKALPYGIEATENAEKNLGKQHFQYLLRLGNLGRIYYDTKQYDKALPIFEEVVESGKKYIGKDNYLQRGWLNDLANTYVKLNQFDKALPLFMEANQNLINQVEQIFTFNTENEKKIFLSSKTGSFDTYKSLAYRKNHSSTELSELNLNNTLFFKGLLLKTSKDILNKMESYGDTIAQRKVIKIRSYRTNLNKQISIAPSKRAVNIDTLKIAIENLERDLTTMYSKKFKLGSSLVKNWKLIQSALKKNEVAIEFSKFDYIPSKKYTDSTLYVAYLIKKEWPHPKVINLFEEKQLKTLLSQKSPNELYTSRGSKAVSIGADQDALYNLIWKPLAKEVENAKTIYYAPDGLLNQLSFAALQENGKPILKKKHHLVQLSSTAVLVEQNIEPEPNNSLFIGGITYDYQIPENNDKKIESYASLDAESLKNTRGIRGIGDSWDYLPGTLKEVNEIVTLYHENGKTYTSLTSDKATESNFKALTGNSPNIIHLATHGFFFENVKQKSDKESNNQYKSSEDPLMRSGLLLAGANYAWQHEGNPYEKEDGILTSLEISNLDLSKTDMVILSACDTGLGEIDGSEGVYGLQRAFKMAGVKIIVMSLWQVPDTETAEFMKLFYGNWLKGKPVREAFAKAQRTMYKKYPTDPVKWAGFVLFE